VPLDVLERQVNGWVAKAGAQKQAPARGSS
jgi:hypothetical protein